MGAWEWPMMRHDRNLTGRSSGIGNMRDPAVAGEISYASGHAGNVWLEDLDGDGKFEFIWIENGRIIVRDEQDRLLWQSGVCQPIVIGFHDLDGNGKEKYIVAVGHSRTLLVYSGANGMLRWSHRFDRETVRLTHSSVRIGPIRPDLKGEQITVWSEGDDFSYLFSFENGVDNGRMVWSNRGIGVGDRTRYRTGVLIGDIHGDGRLSIVVIQHSAVWVVDAYDGEIVWEIEGAELRNYGLAQLLDLDGDGVKEIVFVNDSVQLWTAVIKWQNGRFAYIWDHYIGYSDRFMTTPYWPVRDIEGNGRFEIVYSIGDTDSGMWQVIIVDALTGRVRQELDGVKLLDCGDIDGDGIEELLMEEALTSDVVVCKLLDGRLTVLHRTGDQAIGMLEQFRPLHGNHTNYQRQLSYFKDLNGDGRLAWFAIRDGKPSVCGIGADGQWYCRQVVEELASMVVLNVLSANEFNGYLVKFAEGMRLYAADGSVAARFGERVDSAALAPIVTDIDGDGRAELLVGNAFYRVDAPRPDGRLTIRAAGSVALEPNQAAGASVDNSEVRILLAWDDGSGTKDLLFAGRDAELIRTDCRGEVRWRTKLKGDYKGGRVMSVTIGQFLSPSRCDIYANVATKAMYMNESMVIESATGNIVWRRTDGHDSGMGPVDGYASVRQLENDGLDDLLLLSGEVVMEVDGATGRDLIRKRELSDILGTRWVGSGQLTPVDVVGEQEQAAYLTGVWGINGGLIKRDAGGWRAAWFDYYGNATPVGTRRRLQGIAQADGMLLAGGQRLDYRYGCVNVADGTLLWTYDLGDCTASDTCTGDIDGDGRDEFVFACDDGHVYVLKTDGTLLFKRFVDAPPGDPVLADADGDGWLEIIVTRTDGRLLILK